MRLAENTTDLTLNDSSHNEIITKVFSLNKGRYRVLYSLRF